MSMRKYTPSSHAISGVFVFLLLGIFAVFSTVMVLLGARAYKGTVDRLSEHNAMRIAPAYVRSMVRSDDGNGVLKVEDEAGMPVISLLNEYDGEQYVTRIYCYDGALREWFTEANADFVPEDGEEVCACDDMKAALDQGLLKVELKNGDTWTQVDIALHAMR